MFLTIVSVCVWCVRCFSPLSVCVVCEVFLTIVSVCVWCVRCFSLLLVCVCGV